MPLISSFDPDSPDMDFEAASLRGAKAIYGEVIRQDDPNKLEWAWENRAKPITRENHIREAAACLRAAGWRAN